MERSRGALARALIVGVLAAVSGATAATGLVTGSLGWSLAVLAGGLVGTLTTLLAVGASEASRGDLLPALRAHVDPVTGLPREERLDQAIAVGGAVTLYRFMVEGFRSYNDAFGEGCGDALLAWLARKLKDAVARDGTVFKTRGAGFAVLVAGAPEASAALRERCMAALHEAGEGFRVGCLVGTAALPDEARDAHTALDLAKRRAESQRRATREKLGLRAAADLANVLAMRRPSLQSEELAAALGRDLGLPEEQLGDLEAAFRLCDVGNLAVPASVFERSGELPGHEWQFIQLHTLVGERLLSAGSSMSEVARVVRSSHERFDGAGYPDGLAGEQIPLASRVVFVCSAFADMTEARAHRPALSIDEAIAELERGAGSQFDPEVVRAFRERLAHALDRPGLAPALRVG